MGLDTRPRVPGKCEGVVSRLEIASYCGEYNPKAATSDGWQMTSRGRGLHWICGDDVAARRSLQDVVNPGRQTA
ncbi:hypothetical protein SBA2_30140 [Acidobacteriia bacterium SbA2]|nr:hypothetical protein SBA2_30140 [Acidobacteriia bacterium SbA2]